MNIKKVLLFIQLLIAIILLIFFLFAPICYLYGEVYCGIFKFTAMTLMGFSDMIFVLWGGLSSYLGGVIMIYYACKYARYAEHKKELHVEMCIALTFGTLCLLLFPYSYYKELGTLASFDWMFPVTLKIMYALSGLAIFINLLGLLSCIETDK